MTSTEDIYVIHGLDTRKYYDSISRIMQLDASLTSHYFEGNSILLHIISMLFSDVDFHEADTNKLSIIDDMKYLLGEDSEGDKPETCMVPDYTVRAFKDVEQEYLEIFEKYKVL